MGHGVCLEQLYKRNVYSYYLYILGVEAELAVLKKTDESVCTHSFVHVRIYLFVLNPECGKTRLELLAPLQKISL